MITVDARVFYEYFEERVPDVEGFMEFFEESMYSVNDESKSQMLHFIMDYKNFLGHTKLLFQHLIPNKGIVERTLFVGFGLSEPMFEDGEQITIVYNYMDEDEFVLSGEEFFGSMVYERCNIEFWNKFLNLRELNEGLTR